jgi:hypothetical protein
MPLESTETYEKLNMKAASKQSIESIVLSQPVE